VKARAAGVKMPAVVMTVGGMRSAVAAMASMASASLSDRGSKHQGNGNDTRCHRESELVQHDAPFPILNSHGALCACFLTHT
jgi:hypothetical protein